MARRCRNGSSLILVFSGQNLVDWYFDRQIELTNGSFTD
jgi:hypothetical protein